MGTTHCLQLEVGGKVVNHYCVEAFSLTTVHAVCRIAFMLYITAFFFFVTNDNLFTYSEKSIL